MSEATQKRCPACGHPVMEAFYQAHNVPVHSVTLIRTLDAARAFPKGDIRLAYCRSCGTISNTAFSSGKQAYDSNLYESTQACSPTFNAFHRRLAVDLLSRFNIRAKRVLEIGCGQGEFLSLLCELGENYGLGFDPAYHLNPGDPQAAEDLLPLFGASSVKPEKGGFPGAGRAVFIKDFYSEAYAGLHAEFVCCKMTLEHIYDVGEFIRMVRAALEGRPDTLVFFQVPDAERILREGAFWDIYYEHCTYFTNHALQFVMENTGFEVLEGWRDYGGQYLMIMAQPSGKTGHRRAPMKYQRRDVPTSIDHFKRTVRAGLEEWQAGLSAFQARQQKVVLWGGGSKAVSFLTTLGIGREQIKYVVDINPKKEGTFLAGGGQQVVSPEYLHHFRPDIVILMNPIYTNEIRSMLAGMGLEPDLIPVVGGLPEGDAG